MWEHRCFKTFVGFIFINFLCDFLLVFEHAFIIVLCCIITCMRMYHIICHYLQSYLNIIILFLMLRSFHINIDCFTEKRFVMGINV